MERNFIGSLAGPVKMTGTTLIIFLFLMLSIPIFMENGEAGSPLYDDPHVEVKFDKETYVSKGNPSLGLKATIKGTVTCRIPDETPPSIEVRIRLVFNEEGADRLIGLEQLDFEKDGNSIQEIEVDYFFDNSIIAGEQSIIKVTGTWDYQTAESEPEELEEIYLTVVAGEYGPIELKTVEDQEIQRFAIGEFYDFDIQVINWGNGIYLCEFAVIDHPENVEVELVKDSIHLQPFGDGMLDIRLKQVDGPSQSNIITVRATTVIGGELFMTTINLPFTTYKVDNTEFTIETTTLIFGGGFILIFFVVMFIFLIRLIGLKKKRTDHVDPYVDEVQGYYDGP